MSHDSVSKKMVVQEVKKYIAANFLFDIDQEGKVSEQSNLFEAGILDSYGLIDLVMFLETRFEVDIQDSDFTSGRLASLGGIAETVLSGMKP